MSFSPCWLGKVVRVFGEQVLVEHRPHHFDETLITPFYLNATVNDRECEPDVAWSGGGQFHCQALKSANDLNMSFVKLRDSFALDDYVPDLSGKSGGCFYLNDGEVRFSVAPGCSSFSQDIMDFTVGYPENSKISHQLIDD
jgi:hypothetical protein